MNGAAMYDDPVAFILTVDRNIFFWVLAITFFFSVSVVAVISKGRQWYELLAIFFLTYIACVLLSGVLFTHVLGVPFARLETITIP